MQFLNKLSHILNIHATSLESIPVQKCFSPTTAYTVFTRMHTSQYILVHCHLSSTGFEYSCCTYSLQKQIKAYLLITVYNIEFFKKLVLEGMQILFQLSLSHNIVFKKEKTHKKLTPEINSDMVTKLFSCRTRSRLSSSPWAFSDSRSQFLETLKTKIAHNK